MYLRSVSGESDYLAVEKIYTESFPENERAPLKMLKKRADSGKADFLAVCDGSEIVGMVYVVCCRDLAYMFYIAIDKAKRGMGYDKNTMAALLKRYKGKRFFLALEQPDDTAANSIQRIKRHQFYKSCGLCDLPFKLKEGSVTFAAMGTDLSGKRSEPIILPQEYKELMCRFMGFFMSLMVDIRMI